MGLSKKYLAVSALFRPSLEDKMNAHSFFVLLTACFGLVSCSEVKFKDCGSKSGKPTHLYIDPCTSNPCALVKGKNSTISVSFIPNKAVSSVKASVHGIIAGIPVPFPITGEDGCQKSGLTCPLKAGVEVKYFKTIPVLSSYPDLKLLVKWELTDESNQDIVCIEMPVQIK